MYEKSACFHEAARVLFFSWSGATIERCYVAGGVGRTEAVINFDSEDSDFAVARFIAGPIAQGKTGGCPIAFAKRWSFGEQAEPVVVVDGFTAAAELERRARDMQESLERRRTCRT